MTSRSQLNLFVNSAHVEDLLNYCIVPLLLLSSSVHPWGFKDFYHNRQNSSCIFSADLCPVFALCCHVSERDFLFMFLTILSLGLQFHNA